MKNDFPKIFTVILNYNGRDTILKSLKSVYLQDYPNYELVVADNCSLDESPALAKKYYSGVHFIQNGENFGFAAGNNPAIRFALEKFADYVFLLNNDAMLEKNTLSRLVKAAEEDKKAGILSPLILRADGSIWYAGGKIRWFKMRAEHIFKIEKQEPYETKFASGCAMLIKKDVFREIGLLSEKYFLYYEDADFCVRAAKKGFKVLTVPDAKAVHLEKSEEVKSEKVYWLVLSGLIFFKKNAPAIWKPWIKIYTFLRKIKNRLDVKFKDDEISLAVQKAYGDYKKIKNQKSKCQCKIQNDL